MMAFSLNLDNVSNKPKFVSVLGGLTGSDYLNAVRKTFEKIKLT
jgi:hypothetical protein